MSDYESADPVGSSQDLISGPCPPATAYARRSSRLASQLITPSPSSQLRASGINPGSDQDASQLTQFADFLSHDSPPLPPPPPTSSGKRHSKTPNHPAKKRRACSSSTLASAVSLPSPSSAALASFSEPPAASSSSTTAVPASFISLLDLLQRSITSLTQHLMVFLQNMPRQLSIRPLPHPTLSLPLGLLLSLLLGTSPQLSHWLMPGRAHC
ncbi:hypothetical protein AMECASPLE_036477 [Ameca splendens]|uniref:Uncharacterized protein n=1 Tax=Ameca splendens TaxID=208324 RepID=A0ABV0Z5K2_9TELE